MEACNSRGLSSLFLMCLFWSSKKILTLGLNQDPPPHPNTLRLQRMIRYSATLFVQVRPQGGGSAPGCPISPLEQVHATACFPFIR